MKIQWKRSGSETCELRPHPLVEVTLSAIDFDGRRAAYACIVKFKDNLFTTVSKDAHIVIADTTRTSAKTVEEARGKAVAAARNFFQSLADAMEEDRGDADVIE